jgi:hypothetical protein
MNGTPLDRIFSIMTIMVVGVIILSALSHKNTGSIMKTIGTQWNNSLRAMEAA